ncbi:hypothetical protein V6x_31020 [Gimesia chilikensis]|uniref:Uncharacterized protein n=1 Tax=Gimesia chilikensis TaxID=2605989 RepID=A0A517WDQ1_9PLAN|nr:hypothetical protein V6x_31020 [Gimesia chilikensis]
MSYDWFIFLRTIDPGMRVSVLFYKGNAKETCITVWSEGEFGR